MATTQVRPLNIERLQMEIRLHYPGFAILAGMVDWSTDDKIPTACTNGKFVKMNSEFMGKFGFKSQVFVVLHELLHIVRKHMITRGDRDHQLFNIACDHYINLLLKKTCGDRAEMPKENGKDVGYADRRFDDMSEFEIYDILEQEQKDGGNPQAGGSSLGDVEDLQQGQGQGQGQDGDEDGQGGQGADDGGVSQKEVEALVKQINDAIQTAEAVGKMSGKGSSIWQQLAGELRAPQIKWETILRRFMTNVFPAYRSWAQMDRRMYSSLGVAYPAVVKTGTQELVFGVDCSGSMPRQVVERALAEVVSAMEQCHIVKMHIVYFTSNIDRHDQFSVNQTPKLQEDLPNGGTCLQTFMNYVKKECPNAKGIICMTDSDFGGWPERPSTPVLWGMVPEIIKQYPAPFGEVFTIPEEDN